MIYKSKEIETKQKVLIHLFITHQALQQEYESGTELLFFLIRYSFLLKDNDATQKSCTLKTTHFHIPQGNGENSARNQSLNRLTTIDYPETKDTVYTYGGTNDNTGAAGKIKSIEDASGTLEYEYGKLGEVIKETRVLNTHLGGRNKTETAVMEYRSDYLGRMKWIKYPDGETVSYGYDNGGQVVSVTGKKPTTTDTFNSCGPLQSP